MPRSKIQKRSLKRNQNKNQNKQQKISNKKRQQNRRRRQQRLNGGGGNAIDQMLQKELLSGGAVMRGGDPLKKVKKVIFDGFTNKEVINEKFNKWMNGEGAQAAAEGDSSDAGAAAPSAGKIEAIYGLHNSDTGGNLVYNMLVFQKAGEEGEKVSPTLKPDLSTKCTGFKLEQKEESSGEVTLTIKPVKKEEAGEAKAEFGNWSLSMIQTTDVPSQGE